MEDGHCCQCFKSTLTSKSTQCFSCKLNIHFKCIKIAESDFQAILKLGSNNVKIICNRCNVTMSSVSQLHSSIEEVKTALNERLKRIEEMIEASTVSSPSKEEIIAESVDRSYRATNVILTNVPEDSGSSDVDLANDILEVVDSSAVVLPDNVTRLGKSVNGRPRLLRLRFNSVEMAKLVLRKKDVLKSNAKFNKIGIRDDKTKQQQTYLRTLNDELKKRRAQGENNLMIKFQNNVPKIVLRLSDLSENSVRPTTSVA